MARIPLRQEERTMEMMVRFLMIIFIANVS